MLFIGGPGRSGTSFVAQRLGEHIDVCAFPGLELKLFVEKNGLLDLHHSLVDAYSPNRATVALGQFRRMTEGLISGQFGQPGLSDIYPGEVWRERFDGFTDALQTDGHPVRQTEHAFMLAARKLLVGLAELAARLKPEHPMPLVFLEKTPHALLSIDFLRRIAPGAHFLHVMRDPRSIAYSLRKMRWGPDSLETCCAWVESYCEVWLGIAGRANGSEKCITSTRIEEVSAAPSRWSDEICTRLGLRPMPSLFDGAATGVLNDWAKCCDRADMTLLQARLAKLAGRFGYREAEIGVVKASESSDSTPLVAATASALAGQ